MASKNEKLAAMIADMVKQLTEADDLWVIVEHLKNFMVDGDYLHLLQKHGLE